MIFNSFLLRARNLFFFSHTSITILTSTSDGNTNTVVKFFYFKKNSEAISKENMKFIQIKTFLPFRKAYPPSNTYTTFLFWTICPNLRHTELPCRLTDTHERHQWRDRPYHRPIQPRHQTRN